ncbi:phosphoadenosine phosphosulfate reductase [Jannaschia sp. M317]|uniref:phosphoadenosine phosphosulfate reductase n=1 Tax=Jannaschia sp. M317 TaxID=2867011 RepID=UPI0021A38CF7|nr:phosphoadenosine phosphosulfate reductase [Jannaschia sp. M317]UWQ16495.1 phosphoadenosine phosphosulfate reductase [Jannaschia sp. M317]
MDDQTPAPDDPPRPAPDTAAQEAWSRDLGQAHVAQFRPGNETLIVEFESRDTVAARPEHLPWSVRQARSEGWATLTLMADGRTWYRAPEVIDFFDEMTDEGLFDDYDRVIFLGTGVAGYGAATYSLAAPGATVVLIAPYATRDPALVPWETRFHRDRALSFGPRYGYAPDALDAAQQVYLLSDPTETPDAMHASLFRGPHITQLPARHGGARLRERLEAMDLLLPVVQAAAETDLTTLGWAKLWRARQHDPVWLGNLMRKLDLMDRPWLQAVFAGEMLDATGAEAARRRLNDALSRLQAQGRPFPAGRKPASPPDRDSLRMAGE